MNIKESLVGQTYFSWTVVDQYDEAFLDRDIQRHRYKTYLVLKCSCTHTKKIVKGAFERRYLPEKCFECMKRVKHVKELY